jgi:hypothetical protein
VLLLTANARPGAMQRQMQNRKVLRVLEHLMFVSVTPFVAIETASPALTLGRLITKRIDAAIGLVQGSCSHKRIARRSNINERTFGQRGMPTERGI